MQKDSKGLKNPVPTKLLIWIVTHYGNSVFYKTICYKIIIVVKTRC